MRVIFFWPVVAFLCLLGVPFDRVHAAGPRDELFRLVPDDTTFCLVIQDLRKQSTELDEKSVAARLAKMPFFTKSLQAPEIQKSIQTLEQTLKDLDITREQLRDDILGDAIVFAFRQRSEKPGQDEGIFLIWARDKELLKKLIQRINTLQKASGELKELKEHTHNQQVYFQRTKIKDKGADEFYFVRGNLLGFSSQESVLTQAIDRDRTAAPVEKEVPAWAKHFSRIDASDSILAWMVNPRAFDAEIQDKRKRAVGGEKAFLDEFTNYWKAVEGLAFSLNLQKDVELGLTVRVRTRELPKSAQRFLQEMGKPSELWRAIPDTALLAIGTRLDIGAFSEAFSGFCDPKTRAIVRAAMETSTERLIGRGNLDSVALGLGPDWGFWIAPPNSEEKSWIPQVCFALKVNGSEQGKKAERAIVEALDDLLVVGKLTFGFTVERTKQGEVEVRTIHHAQRFPPEFQPSFASKNGYLLLASSPAVIRRFEMRNPGTRDSDEVPLLRMSGRSWEQYLQTHRKEIAQFIAQVHGTKAEDLLPQIDSIADNLKAFERLEITIRSQPDQATIMIRLKGRESKEERR